MIKNGMRPIHPDEILRKEFLEPLGTSAHRLSIDLRVPATRIHEIINERRGITPDTALRLACNFGGDARSWLNLQADYDLKIAIKNIAKDIEREVRPHAA